MANLNEQQILDVRHRLAEFQKNNSEFSDRVVGKNTGYSATTVNQFRNDKYPVTSSLAEIASKIENFLNNEAARTFEPVSRGHLKFAATNASLKIFKVINYCMTKSKLGLITGDAGIGKSISLQEYCRKNPTSILIEVTPVVSPKSILDEIANKLKIQSNHSRSELFNGIVAQLQNTNRFVIIDEGENLNIACLEVIRRIHDFTNIGMILAGTSRLQKKLRGERGQLQQLYSRVGIQVEVKSFDMTDIKAILAINFPEALKFSNVFLQLSKQNGRLLEHLIALVKNTIAETGEQISDDLIDDAASSLLM
jgi:DNA transposition AAA+ family ATPase